MALSSRLGPWLLGTVKNTVGASATLGQITNMGTTVVSQNKTVSYTDTAASTLCVVPAGSILIGFQLYATTAFTSGSTGTLQLFVNGTAVTTSTTVSGVTTGIIPLVIASTTAAAALLANVGTTDATLTYTFATVTAGAGVILAEYAVRLPDGTYIPTPYTA